MVFSIVYLLSSAVYGLLYLSTDPCSCCHLLSGWLLRSSGLGRGGTASRVDRLLSLEYRNLGGHSLRDSHYETVTVRE